MKYRCPHCGVTISRNDLIKRHEKKTEKIVIRCIPDTKEKWNEFLDNQNLKNSEDGLLVALNKLQIGRISAKNVN